MNPDLTHSFFKVSIEPNGHYDSLWIQSKILLSFVVSQQVTSLPNFSHELFPVDPLRSNKAKMANKAIAKCVNDVPDATGNKGETNVSLTQTLIEEEGLPQNPKEHMKLK